MGFSRYGKGVSAGINKGHVEAMEGRLKQDVLREAKDYGNQIMVAHEDDDYQVVQKWEPVTEVDVQTPLDIYRELEGKPSPCDFPHSVSSQHGCGKLAPQHEGNHFSLSRCHQCAACLGHVWQEYETPQHSGLS